MNAERTIIFRSSDCIYVRKVREPWNEVKRMRQTAVDLFECDCTMSAIHWRWRFRELAIKIGGDPVTCGCCVGRGCRNLSQVDGWQQSAEGRISVSEEEPTTSLDWRNSGLRHVVTSVSYYFSLAAREMFVQRGSNMTGTNCDLFTHKSSRSYLNHLVFVSTCI